MILLVLTLVLLLCMSYKLVNRDLIAPSFIFTSSFLFSALWALLYTKEWNLNLHINTYFVIAGGVFEFIIVSYLIQSIMKFTRANRNIYTKQKVQEIQMNSLVKAIFLIVSIGIVFYSYYAIVRAVHGSMSDISSALFVYRVKTMNVSDDIALPRIVAYGRMMLNACGYWFLYILIQNYIAIKKIDFLSLLIVVMQVLSSFATGGRNGAINIILGGVLVFLFLLSRKNGMRKSISLKTILKLIVLAFVVLVLFQSVGSVVGRITTSNTSLLDYLAKYCGAEIKNLDIFLQSDKIGASSQNQTFIYIVRWLGPKIGMQNTKYALDLPYMNVNGFNLGNVYTTFYPYIYDYGYIGEITLVAVMAGIIQIVYELAKRTTISNKPNYSIVLYMFMFSSLMFSFFSNKFYEQQFNNQFVGYMIIWIIMNKIMFKFKVKKIVWRKALK